MHHAATLCRMTHARYLVIVQSQFDAALTMLEECVRRCPPKQWGGLVAKYPFWQVAYHTLYCTDLYAAKSQAQWQTHPKFHPAGRADVENEYPSREFSKRELLAYLRYTRARVHASLAAETTRTLAGPSGFSWMKVTRAEMPLCSMRHVQHHTGQLSAYLRKANVNTRWQKRGE